MYLAIKDEMITKMQKWVKDENDKMIDEWNALPWYRKLGGNGHIHLMMMARWAGFSKWMNERVAKMRAADPEIRALKDEVS